MRNANSALKEKILKLNSRRNLLFVPALGDRTRNIDTVMTVTASGESSHNSNMHFRFYRSIVFVLNQHVVELSNVRDEISF